LGVHIRLMRLGKKKRPYYRVVVTDGRNQRDGKYIENLGYYQPIEGDDVIKLDLEKYNDWKSKGAVISPIVKKIANKVNKKNSSE